jgi:hypothetical protein
MTHQRPADPLAKFNGMVPRYVRMRRVVELEQAEVVAPPPKPVPEVHELIRDMRPVDAATADLRRRLAAANEATGVRGLIMSGARLKGAAIGVALLVSALVGAYEVLPLNS